MLKLCFSLLFSFLLWELGLVPQGHPGLGAAFSSFSILVLYGPIKGKDERRLAVRLFFVLNEKFARSELSSQEKAAQGVLVPFLVVTKDLRRKQLPQGRRVDLGSRFKEKAWRE